MLAMESVSVQIDGSLLLRDVSYVFPEGSTTVIIGGSGSGKSLMLKTAACIRPPEAGKVLWNGKDIQKIHDDQLTQMRRRWGFMFQDSALWANMSVYENLALVQRFHFPNRSEEDISRRISDLAEEMGFAEDLGERPAAFSAGLQKVVSFMRAAINEPHLLFLDEPSTFVDRYSFKPIVERLKRFRQQGRTIIMVTHNVELARGIGDHLVIMKKGSCIASGAMADVLNSTKPEVQREIEESFQQGEQNEV